ncbi:hypothetical protein GCM10029964_070420 [Kibdelosporangium lantanae]
MTAWTAQPGELKTLQAVVFFSVVALIAILLNSTMIALLRFFEGYWARPFSTFGKYCHRARLARLTDEQYRYLRYPPKTRTDEVMPTRLGNLFKSAELYPATRYGMDGVLFWPRLYSVLPDSVQAGLSDARSTLERLLVLSFLSAAFAVGTSGYLLVVAAPWPLYVCCLVGGWLVACLCYRAAVGSADGYTEQVRAAFDVYRRDLAAKLAGETAVFDRSEWMDMGRFWYLGLPAGTKVEPTPARPGNAGTRNWRPTMSTVCTVVVAVAAVVGALR